ncbi:ribonuclease Z [Bacillus shivajii]|uniref:ribonuclease Z n=1 Tax=Bacillus shivajii TaxID=1983719 RepID=UPI001CF97BDD|nr:ribonuclease Z [Bacillus shivajii]UCZ53178.1 ribonuclease Z [Bacillus shivajii]
MNITFLGTGSGVPAKHRNVSSLALHLMNKQASIWLFDCGEATQHQILHTPIKLRRVEKIFITHLHGDHIFGLPGVLGSRSFQGAETPLNIYGPKGIKEFIEISLKTSGTHLRYPLYIEEFNQEGKLFEDNEFLVSTAKLVHGLPSFGFRVQQKDLPGPLLMDKVKAAQIEPGPILKKLKDGRSITLPDGRTVNGQDFIGPPKKGKVVTVLGDTRFNERSIPLAKNANVLIHEATFAKEDHLLANEYFHSTTVEAATIAKQAGVKQLILNHISTRYQAEDIKTLLNEAKEIFPHTFVADDFSTFKVPTSFS